jgi:hypothetical protein
MIADNQAKPAPVKPLTQQFRGRAAKVRLDPDQLRRQAGAMSAAKNVLLSREEVMGFFNNWSADLGGRPLDIATAACAASAAIYCAIRFTQSSVGSLLDELRRQKFLEGR